MPTSRATNSAPPASGPDRRQGGGNQPKAASSGLPRRIIPPEAPVLPEATRRAPAPPAPVRSTPDPGP
ncbi:ArsA family ATPase, partial [Frankia sp. AiPs1]|nr:ArsA family ATPase [Frankia sp. AiPs1]